MNQYVYWICFAFPAEQTVAQNGIKIIADFSRQNFREVAAEAYQVCNIELVETMCCQEPRRWKTTPSLASSSEDSAQVVKGGTAAAEAPKSLR